MGQDSSSCSLMELSQTLIDQERLVHLNRHSFQVRYCLLDYTSFKQERSQSDNEVERCVMLYSTDCPARSQFIVVSGIAYTLSKSAARVPLTGSSPMNNTFEQRSIQERTQLRSLPQHLLHDLEKF